MTTTTTRESCSGRRAAAARRVRRFFAARLIDGVPRCGRPAAAAAAAALVLLAVFLVRAPMQSGAVARAAASPVASSGADAVAGVSVSVVGAPSRASSCDEAPEATERELPWRDGDGDGDGALTDDDDIGGDDDDDAKRLDCSMRLLFLERSEAAVPWRESWTDVREALEIDERCEGFGGGFWGGAEVAAEAATGRSSATEADNEGDGSEVGGENGDGRGGGEDSDIDDGDEEEDGTVTFYVCPRNGNDDDDDGDDGTNDGRSRERPFRTVRRALHASRKSAAQGQRRTILLEGGVHYLDGTIELTPADSDLTIRSVSGKDRAWLSGGILVESSTAGWKPSSSSPGSSILAADVSHLLGGPGVDRHNVASGLFTVEPHRRMTLARYPNADVERWDATDRYLTSDDVSEWIFPPTLSPPEMYTIDLTDPANPTGYTKDDSAMEDYNKFGTGRGGACSSVWGDGPSYWCGEVSAGGWAEVDRKAAVAGRLNIPAGVVVKGDMAGRVKKKWSAEGSRGAVVHVAHTQGWAWHMFNVSDVSSVQADGALGSDNDEEVKINFDTGGWQGGRNWQCKDKNGHLSDCDGPDKKLAGGGWYVEGVLEELDEEGEFYFDAVKAILYFYPPVGGGKRGGGGKDEASSLPPASSIEAEDEHAAERAAPSLAAEGESGSFSRDHRQRNLLRSDLPSSSGEEEVPDVVMTNLRTLIKVQGTKNDPVRNIRLLDLGFRDAAKTYMTERWSAPSGGDWALHRNDAAVRIEGAEDVVIDSCHFRRLDGNAILLSGYARRADITRSEFEWIGEGAVATWGDTADDDDGYDATSGEQPRHSLLERNVMSNLGLYQKQSSGWGQNKACENIVRDNVMFNLPRAAINFNDGLGGNNTVRGNVIFNTCRESGDHGPINSWDRMPFLANTTASPTPSFQPAPTHTVGNLILANYGASQGFDNDDGSSYYYTRDNVFYDADGFKMDYGGHDSEFARNLVYGRECFGTGSFRKGHSDRFHNNTCIIAGGGRDDAQQHNVGNLFQCTKDGLLLYDNSYYTIDGIVTWTCPGVGTYNLTEMRTKLGMENGTVVGKTPKADVIVGWARNIILGLDERRQT